LSPVGSFRSFNFRARVQASLSVSLCVVTAACPRHGVARLGRTLGHAVVGLVGPGRPAPPLPLHHGPPCLGAVVAVVPHRAALASPSHRRLASGCPGVAGTTPCGLGGQRERERVVAFGVTRRPCSTDSASCPCPSRRPCRPPPSVFLPPSPPWTRFRAPPCLLHLTSIRCGRRVAATWSTSSTLLLSFWSHGSLQLECQSDRALLNVGTPLFLGPPSTDCPRPIGCTPRASLAPMRGALQGSSGSAWCRRWRVHADPEHRRTVRPLVAGSAQVFSGHPVSMVKTEGFLWSSPVPMAPLAEPLLAGTPVPTSPVGRLRGETSPPRLWPPNHCPVPCACA
jgi:hypothetical protein